MSDSDDWNFGGGNFTIDFWVRFNAVGKDQALVGQWVDNDNVWRAQLIENGVTLNFYAVSAGTVITQFHTSWSSSANTWYHIAFVRNGNTPLIFINGIAQSVYEVVIISSKTLPDIATNLFIGRTYNVFYLDGWLDELRISKGIARWTSDFTPPSSPYGKVATVTSQKKFGTASGEFHGSGDYLALADSDDWNFGNGDFTIDLWVKFNSLPPVNYSAAFYSQRTDGNNESWFGLRNDGNLYFKQTSGGANVVEIIRTPSPVITTGQWYHIALIRNGNVFRIYVDGTQVGSDYSSSATLINYSGNLVVGVAYADSPAHFLDGGLDEFRISKGIARWTSNFTPPSAPYDVDTISPTVSSTSPTSSATGVGVSSAISATFSEGMDASTITTSTFTLTSSSGGSVSGTVSYGDKTATFTPSSNLSYSTTYTATITTGVKDVGGNAMSSNYTWSFATDAAPDTTAPSGSITINNGASYTNSTAVTLNLSATDGAGVTGYYVSDSPSAPSSSASGWTSVTTATNFTANVSYPLSGGDGNKTVYVWYKDFVGNVSSTVNGSITLDTTSPTVTITSPTSSGAYTSAVGSVGLGGSASDSSSGIGAVTWNNTTTGSNGTATGTTNWTISAINLSMGENTINVTARDGANNTGTGTIKVTYSGNAPTATTSAATSVTATSATLNGTVNANGLSTSAWFQYGLSSGTYTGTSTTQSVSGSSNTTVSIAVSGLSSGKTYYYRLAAQSSAGTSYGSELSFSTPDSNAPTGTVTINNGAAYTRRDEVILNLSATDDVMVGGYYVSTSSTPPSSSTYGWTVVSGGVVYTGNVSYKLSDEDGSKTVYVWFKDSSGNVSGVASASIILDETPPVVVITSPTQDTTYKTTSSTITLGGGASDVTSGVKTVTWSSDKGGNGTANGTASWTISNISLSVEDNVITVTVTDNAGNTATDVLTVRYAIPTPMPSPTPAVTPSPTPQASPSPTPRTSPSPTPTLVATPAQSPSPVVTPTPRPSPLATPTPAPTPIVSPTPQAASSPAPQPSPSPTVVATPGTTPTQQPTPSPTPVITPPAAETPAPSPTLAKTPTPRPTSPPKDTEVPIGSISIQGGASYTNLSEITLDLLATDNVGVTGYYLASSLPMPTAVSSGWTPISSTTNYHDTVSYKLTGGDGSKTIYVWYKDASGNVSNTVSASLVLDTKAPKVTITSPTSGEKYKSDTGTISLGGTASDGASGVRSVTWSNNKGGSGTASGTDTWTIADITLRGNDENKITVTAVDNAGNSATDEIRVEYTVITPTPQGTPSPVPSVTLTPLPTPTATLKPTPMPSPTLKSTPTLQPSPTATLITTPTPLFTPVITPTPQPSPSPAKGGTLYGMVTDDDNNPLEGVAVAVKGKGISEESGTDGDGYYRFDGLAAGKYKLTYEKEGYSAQKQEVALEDGEVKALETVAMKSLRNEKGAISGHVMDTSGNPLESVTLKLKGKKKKSYNGSTDEDGFFEFQDLEADTYTLIAKMRGYKRVQQRITLKKGENKEIEIAMKGTRR